MRRRHPYLDQERASIGQVRQLEEMWRDNFAAPLILKRKEVDAGNATVAEMQIFYLQQNPAQWLQKSTEPLDEAERVNNKILAEKRATNETASYVSSVVSILGTVLAVLLGLGIAYFTSRSITEPLGRLIAISSKIGHTGDLDHTVDIHRNDEIGELASTFSNMVVYLKEMAQFSEAIAGGDLTVRVQPRSPRDTLAHAFTRMTDGLSALARSVRDGAAQVASGSAQVANASDESAKISVQASSAIDEVTSTMHEMSINVQNMVKNTQTQASSVSETSASIDQLVASIQRVADTAKVLLDISHRSREEVHSGIGTMEKATDGLNRINNSIQSSSSIIGELGHSADDIGKIVGVIDDLAEQTNLLALNAAIEAARAGEHGLGFAVVADEVRKLAEKSAQSTKEIAELIQSIQREARKAVENMEKSTSIVDEGLTLGSRTQHRAAQDRQRGRRGLQVCSGDRRGDERAVAWIIADRTGHHSPERDHARDQLIRRRASLWRAGCREVHGTDARTGTAVHLRFDRTGRLLRADVANGAHAAGTDGPLLLG